MSDKNNRIISFRARAKGKKVFPVTVTLTQKQIDWLQRQPNASALIRKILGDLIASEEVVQDKLGVISLNLQLNDLQEKLDKLTTERFHYYLDNDKHWKHIGKDGGYVDIENPETRVSDFIPKPFDTEDAKVALRVLQGYDEARRSLEAQIDEIKRKILQNG